MKKEVLVLVSLMLFICLSPSVYSLQCTTGLSPTSSNPVSNLVCGPEVFTENCVNPDSNAAACTSFVCMDDGYNNIAGQIGATYLPPLCDLATRGFATNCASTASKGYSFIYGVLSGEQFPHGGYTSSNPHDVFQSGCCGDDSTSSNSVERQFAASSPGDGQGSRCCATPPGDSPEVVYKGYCCGLGSSSAPNIRYFDADNNQKVCNGIEDTSQGVYSCSAGSGEVIADLQNSQAFRFIEPSQSCGSGTETCYFSGSRFGPGTTYNTTTNEGCCGDDNQETNTGCFLNFGLIDGSSCNSNDYFCRTFANSQFCIYESQEYVRWNAGTCTSGSPGGTCHNLNDFSSDLEVCTLDSSTTKFEWTDPDQGSNQCNEVGKTWISNSNYCENDPAPGRWGTSDEDCDDAGQDLLGTNGFCCGDDNNEFVNTAGGSARCCTSASSDYDDCIYIPPTATTVVDIISPPSGNLNQQSFVVVSNFSVISSSDPSLVEVSCAVTTVNNPPAYSGLDDSTWTQTKSSSVGQVEGSFNFNFNLLFGNNYNITVGCLEYAVDGTTGYDTVQLTITTCGNNVLEPTENCDVVSGVTQFNLASSLCSDYDPIYTSGSLQCNSNCELDVSSCTGPSCLNGVLDPGEQCSPRNTPWSSSFERATDGTCDLVDPITGQPLAYCNSNCQCLYQNPGAEGYSIRFSGTCVGTDTLGIGTAEDILVTYYPDGTNSSIPLAERNCVNLQVDEPFMGTTSVLLLIAILVIYYVYKKKSTS